MIIFTITTKLSPTFSVNRFNQNNYRFSIDNTFFFNQSNIHSSYYKTKEISKLNDFIQ